MLNKLKNYRIYISPFFLVRFYLKKDIGYITAKYSFRGTILDIGCGDKPFRNYFTDVDYKGIDFKNYSLNKDLKGGKPDFYFTQKYSKNFELPFKKSSFNSIVSFQVLEHHMKPDKMLSEISRITKKGGYILISAPFLGGIHEEPHDYQRFTKYGLTNLFESNHFKIIEIKEQGSLFSTISMLFNEYLNNIAGRSKLHYIFITVVFIPFLLFSYLSIILDKVFKSNKIFFNYLILARKN